MTEAAGGDPTRRRSWPFAVALRYLKSGREDAYVSFLSAVAVGGIGLGVAALVLALSALNGLQEGLRNEVLRRLPSLEIELPHGADVAGALATLRGVDGVAAAERRLRGNGWVLLAASARPVEIVGYDAELPEAFPDARRRAPGLYVSDRFARLYGLEVGDVVEIASTRSRLSPLGPVPRVRRLPLTETFAHAPLEPSERIAMPFEDARALLGDGSLHLVVETVDGERAGAVAAAARRLLGEGAAVRTWRELNAALLLALRLEKRLMFIALFLVVLVGALALVSDLSLIIASRRAEIGILATMGADTGDLRRIFLGLGSVLAVGGTLAGGLLGAFGALALDRSRLLRLPGDVYLLDHVPFRLEAGDLLGVALLTLGVALACCWVAASKVASLDPVEALRG